MVRLGKVYDGLMVHHAADQREAAPAEREDGGDADGVLAGGGGWGD